MTVIAKATVRPRGLKQSPELVRLLHSIPELRLIRNDDGVSSKSHGARSLASGQRAAWPRATKSVDRLALTVPTAVA